VVGTNVSAGAILQAPRIGGVVSMHASNVPDTETRTLDTRQRAAEVGRAEMPSASTTELRSCCACDSRVTMASTVVRHSSGPKHALAAPAVRELVRGRSLASGHEPRRPPGWVHGLPAGCRVAKAFHPTPVARASRVRLGSEWIAAATLERRRATAALGSQRQPAMEAVLATVMGRRLDGAAVNAAPP